MKLWSKQTQEPVRKQRHEYGLRSQNDLKNHLHNATK